MGASVCTTCCRLLLERAHRSTASLPDGLAYQLILLSTEWVLQLDFPAGQSCMITSL